MKDSREGLSPALNLPAVLEVLLQHAHYTAMEIRIEALRWLLWLQEKIPKRVSWAHQRLRVKGHLTPPLSVRCIVLVQ